ncbi:MAG: hypothetical protein JNK63_01840 [Chthonomonas sp.]|nr:hypothetical protein [Chthonomonas sp.]
MKPKTLIIIFCIVGLLGGFFAKVWLDTPSDQELIRETLREATRNGKEGKPGGVHDYLSGSFKVGDYEPSGADISEFIKSQRPEVTVLEPNPVIRGEVAEIVSPVEIKFGVGNIGASNRVEGVRIVLHKESALKYGVFPTPRWKIVEVTAPTGNPFGQ